MDTRNSEQQSPNQREMIQPQDLINGYDISTNGEVTNKLTGRKLKWDTSTGYAAVTLSKNSNKKRFLVHRLVAITHTPNPENKPCVNHLDGDKLNNHVSNLQWCTYSENERHSFDALGKKIVHSEATKMKISKAAKGRDMMKAVLASAKKNKGKPARNRRPVVLNGIYCYDSITLAAKLTGTNISSIINNLKGRSKTTKLGTWEYQQNNLE